MVVGLLIFWGLHVFSQIEYFSEFFFGLACFFRGPWGFRVFLKLNGLVQLSGWAVWMADLHLNKAIGSKGRDDNICWSLVSIWYV